MSVKKDTTHNRPLKFPNVKDLSDTIDKFFNDCDANKKPYTITGLCLCLDTSRNTLLSYEKCLEIEWLDRLDDKAKRAYVNTIKRAKLRCENYAEEQLLNPLCSKSPIGSIFALKNYGWADKQEIVQTNNNINVTLEDEE